MMICACNPITWSLDLGLDCHLFEASLGYTLTLRSTWASEWDLIFRKLKEKGNLKKKRFFCLFALCF